MFDSVVCLVGSLGVVITNLLRYVALKKRDFYHRVGGVYTSKTSSAFLFFLSLHAKAVQPRLWPASAFDWGQGSCCIGFGWLGWWVSSGGGGDGFLRWLLLSLVGCVCRLVGRLVGWLGGWVVEWLVTELIG